jgi:hypothetical protein
LFTESAQLFTESGQLFTESGQWFVTEGSEAEAVAAVTKSAAQAILSQSITGPDPASQQEEGGAVWEFGSKLTEPKTGMPEYFREGVHYEVSRPFIGSSSGPGGPS